MTLHGAGKALTDRGAGNVHELALDEMVGGDLRAHVDQVLRAHAELRDLPLRLHIGHGETAALGAREPLHLAVTGAELHRRIAVLLGGALADDLTLVETQHRDGNVLPGIGEDPGHADLLRDDT